MSEVLFCLCWCCPNTVNISEWKSCPSAYNETFILNNAAPAHTARQNTQETTNDMETDQLANKYSSHKTEEELAARFNMFLPNVRQGECVFTMVWKYTWHWRWHIFHNNACAWNKMHLCVTSCIKLNTVIIQNVLFPPSCLENLFKGTCFRLSCGVHSDLCLTFIDLTTIEELDEVQRML